jgi:NADH-quinone oxidoreductase subunit G
MNFARMSATAPQIKSPEPTLTVRVDGQSVEVPRTMPHPLTGNPMPTTMIQACQMARVEVPHYCYHPKLPVAGNCRMCLVEFGTPALGPDRKPLFQADGQPLIKKSPRPAIACATPVSPGMEIYTCTPGVKAMREAVLEFLLLNHPLDCPICDQAGECRLQEYSAEHGIATSRFVEEKVHKPKQVDLGPRIMLDDERCILCTRCIRFTRDVVGDDALGIVNRGSYNTLTHFPGQAFDNNYTLNTVDICPVGALTAKDFRFQMRVWFLKETKSLCPSCGTGCNILIGSREDRIYRYTPRENDAVNACWMCDYGRLNYKWISRADRLSEPEARAADGARERRDWAQILPELARRLKQAASGATALVVSARQSNEELFLLGKLARNSGALIDAVPRPGEGDRLLVHPDRNPNSQGVQLLGLASAGLGKQLPQIAAGIAAGQIKVLIAVGEDVTPFIPAELLDRLDLLVAVDVLPNATTARAHYVLPGCAPAEKRGTFTNVRARVQKFMQAVPPPGQARPEWMVFRELGALLTGEAWPATIEGLFNPMANETPAFHGLRWSDLGDTGVIVPGAK